MLLKDLIEPLKSVLNLGKKNSDAWRRLLDIVTNDPDAYADPDFGVSGELTDQHINKLLSGNRSIAPSYAGKICDAEFDPGLLADRVDKLAPSVRARLAQAYAKHDPSLTKDSVGQWCANKLTDFILSALKNEDPRKAEVEERIKQHTQRELLKGLAPFLVQEVNSICPQKGCNNSLIQTNDLGKACNSYEIVAIDPDIEDVRQSNLIALCPTCAKAYSGDSLSTRQYLLDRKRDFSIQQKNNAVLHPEQVEEAIRSVLQKLHGLTKKPSRFGLKTDPPFQVQQKIPNNFLLATRIEDHVANWFKFIHKELQTFVYGDGMSFDLLKNAISYKYIQLEAQNLSPEEIVNELARYLSVTTAESQSVCEIVVAYFIQNCEVFRATT